jgi:glutamate--cysteine ligase catalytic subunit
LLPAARDSVSLFREKIREDGDYDETDTDHFENIQSTNWQTMRFKPPPPGDTIGRTDDPLVSYTQEFQSSYLYVMLIHMAEVLLKRTIILNRIR